MSNIKIFDAETSTLVKVALSNKNVTCFGKKTILGVYQLEKKFSLQRYKKLIILDSYPRHFVQGLLVHNGKDWGSVYLSFQPYQNEKMINAYDLKTKFFKTMAEGSGCVRIVHFRHLPPSWPKKHLIIQLFLSLDKTVIFYLLRGKLRSLTQEENDFDQCSTYPACQ